MTESSENSIENIGFSNTQSTTDEYILSFSNVPTNEFDLFRMNRRTNRFFFCSTILMKESIDDLTNQAIDLVLGNDALHKRIVEPLKRKIVPYVVCGIMTNLTMFILLVYLARRLSLLPLLPLPQLPRTPPGL